VAWMGWNMFFIATVPLALPGLLLLARYDQWQTMSTKPPTAKLPLLDWSLIGVFVFSLIALSSDPIWSWLGQKEFGSMVVKGGAIGIVAIVVIGLIRPYLALPGSGRAKEA